MGKITGFRDYPRVACPQRPPLERIEDFAPFRQPLPAETRREQAGRCMDCGVPFCQAGVRDQGAWLGCPLHNRVPEWNDMLWRGNGSQALSRLLKTNCFPEFTGRVCPAPCEKACVCGTFGQPVTIRDNELAIIEEAFARGYLGPCPPDKRSGKTVAVVGSGPAGLAAAYYLNRRGHTVTVLEQSPRPGGLLTYGIPAMKLEKEVVARRLALMEAEGVAFRTGVAVGKDLSPEELDRIYDGVVFADFTFAFGVAGEFNHGDASALPLTKSPHLAEGKEPPKLTKVDIYCPAYRFEKLKQSLEAIGITGMTVTSTMGCGAQRGGNGMYRGVPVSMALRPTVQVSVVVSGIPPERVIETAKQALHTGKLGDGKIFVTSVEEAVKVRTGETGYDALQDEVG